MKPTTYFISGHRDLTEEEFNIHYASKIRKSNAQSPSCGYILGDASGCDKLAQEFLRKIGVSPERICIHHVESKQPANKYKYNLHSHSTESARRNYMTHVSTSDIAWVRPGCEDSEVRNNILRRRELNKRYNIG